MTESALATLRRLDYTPPDFLIDTVHLRFDLREEESLVRARLEVRRNPAVDSAGRPLVLNGGKLDTRYVGMDGEELEPGGYVETPESMTIAGVPDAFVLETVVALKPEENTELVGLYRSGGNFYTDLEPQGFRKITWFVDRPDVMARFTTRIEADKESCPVLLSNGNPKASGELEGGRHWRVWEDPFPKPCYLFAMVAGQLGCLEGSYRTMSGRDVKLEVWTEPENVERCHHALHALKMSMDWDERRFGREYDLDVYMIVAVGDFNAGAMENKGLNVFNSKYVLASPETATDADFEGVEGVIAHEYFHNWTGNRVTLRDWFDLTLKEGLTVYRDQEFSADTTSRPVKRIASVRGLRERQIPEDAGPMAHPVRPDEVVEVANFFTATVYQKGAEVIRMYEVLLGTDGFRRGMDLYFERHDGQAVTCDDFRAAMADANGADLSQFERWYSQSGTPRVAAHGARKDGGYELTLSQALPAGKLDPGPLMIPVRTALLGTDGGVRAEQVLRLTEREQTFRFEGVDEPVVPSLFRDYSAPVRCEIERPREDLAFLLAHDTDPFNRWDAGQELALAVLLELTEAAAAGRELSPDPRLSDALGNVLRDESLDGSTRALTLALPGERVVAQHVEVIDPDAIHAAHRAAERSVAASLREELLATYARLDDGAPYAYDRAGVDRRRLKNRSLGLLASLADGEGERLARAQFEKADNMTDSLAALLCLVEAGGEAREEVLAAFYARWKDDALVLDKWFAVQAASSAEDTFERVRSLSKHADFTLKNPNRMRALLTTFASLNQVRFHGADGAAYEFIADQVIELDALNPKVGSRLAGVFADWKRLEPTRRAAMERALVRMDAAVGSSDVSEVVGKALRG